jgi:hypothetical protein
MTTAPLTTTLDLTPERDLGDHPLSPLVHHYMQLRALAQEADRTCERIAPTPITMSGDHPADALMGDRRDYYQAELRKREAYHHAAHMAHRALLTVIDNLGGI